MSISLFKSIAKDIRKQPEQWTYENFYLKRNFFLTFADGGPRTLVIQISAFCNKEGTVKIGDWSYQASRFDLWRLRRSFKFWSESLSQRIDFEVKVSDDKLPIDKWMVKREKELESRK